jgi:putative transposase
MASRMGACTKGRLRGMQVSEARRLRALEEENRRLKHLVAGLTLDKQALQAVMAKKWEVRLFPRAPGL